MTKFARFITKLYFSTNIWLPNAFVVWCARKAGAEFLTEVFRANREQAIASTVQDLHDIKANEQMAKQVGLLLVKYKDKP